MDSLAGRRITVAGLGLHGGAVGNIQWLHGQGARLTVTDLKSEDELRTSLEALAGYPDITFVLGEHRLEDFQNADLVLRNPAMPRNSEYLAAARAAGVPIEMDSSLFFQLSPSRSIIGITGSKGKSTTTNAIAHLLRLSFENVVTIGIDQTSPLGSLPEITPDTLVVFELSSWRLEAMDEHGQSPQTAVVTSLYRDHLNTYDSFEAYIETKKTIVRHQGRDDRVLLNADDERLREWPGDMKGRTYWYSLQDEIPGEGICIRDDMVTISLGRNSVPLFPVAKLGDRSEHERRNVLPAIFLSFTAGVPEDSIALQLRGLNGLAHRLERVRTVDEVEYINDSAATMPDATIAALKSLRGRHVVHILGGGHKGLVYDELARMVAGQANDQKARSFDSSALVETEAQAWIRAFVWLPGSATDEMKRLVLGAYASPPPSYEAASMADAVRLAQKAVQPGDVVLLSPGATSFGLFQHEFDRGDQFKAAVRAL